VSADTSIEYPRFKWLVPGKIAGAPHPDLFGGLPMVASFLREQGIGGIVTLYERPLVLDVESPGFEYLFAETPDFRPPSDLPRILAFIETQVEQGRGVLVHCFAGIGRTGTVLAAWLLRQEPTLSAEEAVARVRDGYIPEYAQARFPEHPSQLEALQEFARAR
jgi:atypical dual specificity phosphatase